MIAQSPAINTKNNHLELSDQPTLNNNYSMHSMPMRTIFIRSMAVLFLFTVRPVFAMGFQDAVENLTLFEFASQSTEFCEQRGYPSRPVYSAWLKKHAHVHKKSSERVQAETELRGLPKSAQEQVLAEGATINRRRAQEYIAQKGVPCEKFRSFLDGYHTLLKQ